MRLKLYKNKQDRDTLRTECIEKGFTESKLVAHQLRMALNFGGIKSQNAVGLASNQVGLNSSVFIALIDGKWESFINPRLEAHSKKMVAYKEGCLSLKKQFYTNRYEWVKISYERLPDKRVTKKYSGFSAIIIQHELDHLNGKLCKDGGVNE
ncbi:MAG: putative peptide deformylase [Prokaryotic dsDNA virus sp.]|nr:MAG: putative peptide deformylase [Prokaryotic dsDNA virus sp.]QDP59842.1 MAG: putative peptide deformylase [Prokaryotic dsDNA virus sp.]|tara:strand:- start:1234 stop:1689 length:456 start_codon:yes stop_codon:yes gene_type:complete